MRQRLPARGLVHLGFKVSSLAELERRMNKAGRSLVRVEATEGARVLYGPEAAYFACAVGVCGEHLVFWSNAG